MNHLGEVVIRRYEKNSKWKSDPSGGTIFASIDWNDTLSRGVPAFQGVEGGVCATFCAQNKTNISNDIKKAFHGVVRAFKSPSFSISKPSSSLSHTQPNVYDLLYRREVIFREMANCMSTHDVTSASYKATERRLEIELAALELSLKSL